jgi:hypothetical protein
MAMAKTNLIVCWKTACQWDTHHLSTEHLFDLRICHFLFDLRIRKTPRNTKNTSYYSTPHPQRQYSANSEEDSASVPAPSTIRLRSSSPLSSLLSSLLLTSAEGAETGCSALSEYRDFIMCLQSISLSQEDDIDLEDRKKLGIN